jgi:hypothetical protein
MENEEKIAEFSAPKGKRPYFRRPIKDDSEKIQNIAPPNPTILALEAKIYELSEQRSQAQMAISRANQQFQHAQQNLKFAQDEFQRLDGEVQYRMQLIGQMRGGPPQHLTPNSESPWHGQLGQLPPQQTYPWPQPQSPTYTPATPYPQYPAPFDPRMVPSSGIGGIPGNNMGLYPDVGGSPDGARTESAEGVRMEEMRTRGY